MNPTGYLVFIGLILLPGLGVGELLQVWRETASLTERMAMAFGLGLSLDTLVLIIRTSGLRVGGIVLAGIDSGTLYAIIGTGFLALLASVIIRRRIQAFVRPRTTDAIFFAIILVQAAMILLYFQKYPIFPEYNSGDYMTHVQLAQELSAGSIVSVPSGILYYGVHLFLGSAFTLVGGEPLVTIRVAMAILALLSSLLFYLAGVSLFSNESAAIIAVAFYSVSGAIWFGSVFNSGLYPNFFGIMISLVLICAFVKILSGPSSIGAWIFLVLATIAAYFSHYSTLTLLPVILVIPAIQFAKGERRSLLALIIPTLLVILPAVIVALADPSFIVSVLQLATASGGNVVGGTALSSLLSGFPILGFMALEVDYDVGFALMLFFFAIYLWKGLPSKQTLVLVPLGWFIGLLVVSPLNNGAWRFAYEALVPLTFICAYGIWRLLPSGSSVRRRRRLSRGTRAPMLLILSLVMILLLAGSWGEELTVDATSDSQLSAQAQNSDFSAMNWLKSNTPANATYLSVSDWRFLYTSVIIGRQSYYQFFATPQQAIPAAQKQGIEFILVTNLVTVSLPPQPSLFPWNNFPSSSDSNLTLIYSNPNVRIYKLI